MQPRYLCSALLLGVTLAAAPSLPGATLAPEAFAGMTLQLPAPGDHALYLLSPTVLALERINTKASTSAPVDSWNFVDGSGTFQPPALSQLQVLVDGQPATVQSVGFRRRALYAPLAVRDLRLENALFLVLAQPLTAGQSVTVQNADGTLWPATFTFSGTAAPERFNPALHVNQEGYTVGLPKVAMAGWYLGSLGELEIGTRAFSLVNVSTGAVAFSGTLTPRTEYGWAYTPAPYQKVMQADFSAFNTPGVYRLQVDGLGASENFMVDAGIAMNHARAYALGLYHQRCGTTNGLPWTRFTHDACHTALADVPVPQASFANAWANIGSENGDYANNPRHTAPRLNSQAAQLYPFVRTGKIDVSGGHHDAGDYSKYTINSALLIEALTVAADVLPGVGALDNLGLPESGDGLSDLLQEAKWEADYLLKMQDSDGGFYFLVYPRDRKYESNVTPDHGDPQIVYPKNTSATASATGALAELASSPLFRQQFPAEAARYLQAARNGWGFLQAAIAAKGKDGAYQKLTHYGDTFMHDDELAWAACGIFVATGDESAHTLLKAWYTPDTRETQQWTWWRCFEAYGAAARLYAFAVRTGRLEANRLDPAYLARCVTEVTAAGDDQSYRSTCSAYGTSYEIESKRFRTAGWYFSPDRAFDIAVASQLKSNPNYLPAIVTDLNYEAGCNPGNVSFLTGYGTRQLRDIVNQYAQNDRHVLPPTGIPVGNFSTGFQYLSPYGSELGQVTFPGDGLTTAPYPFYDRWGDSYNTTNEAVGVNQARGLGAAASLAAGTSLASQPWSSAAAQIAVPAGYAPVGVPATMTLQAPGLDLSGATVVWEANGQAPVYGGATFSMVPATIGIQWVEAEAHWPDGRRVFAQGTFPTCLNNNDTEFVSDANTIALYHFNGNYQDAGPNALHLTATGNTTLAGDNSGWNGHPSGQVARFSGAGDTLTLSAPDSKVLPGTAQQPFTIEARIYPRSYSAYGIGDLGVISLYQYWDCSFEVKDRKWNSPAAPVVMAGNSTAIQPAQWDAALTRNTWHKLKITYATSGLTQTWVDDQLVASFQSSLINAGRTNAWTLTLGNFVGDLDEVRFSNVLR